jgi:8-oxo-dGTP pyrophosphatase MutT (NUDIX family)
LDDYSELTGERPELIRGGDMNLADLGGPAPELSTGLILTWRNRLVFGLDPRAIPLAERGSRGILAFTGIGGHLDPGETWTQAVTREALEEASIPIALGDSAVTYLCREGAQPQPIAYRWTEPHRPLLVWVATFDLRRGPNRERTPVTLVNAVFRGAALGPPAPSAEISGLILLDADTLLRTYAAPQPLGVLQGRGAQIIGPDLPPETLLAPGGSAYFYAQWLAWQDRG